MFLLGAGDRSGVCFLVVPPPSPCAYDYMACTALHFFSVVSLRLPVVVTTLAPQGSLEASTRIGSSNGDRGPLDGGQIQGLADRSHEGEGQYRLYGTDQFTCHLRQVHRGAGHQPPRVTLNAIAAPHNMKQRQRNWLVYNHEGRRLVHCFFPPRGDGRDSGREIVQSTRKTTNERTYGKRQLHGESN